MRHTVFLMLLLASALLWAGPARAQSPQERQAIDLLFARDFAGARKAFGALLQAQPESPLAAFGMAKVVFEEHKALMAQEAYRNKFKNFQRHFDLLQRAHGLAVQAAKGYRDLTPAEQDRMRKSFSSTDDKIRADFPREIQQEAYAIIDNAPYRKNLLILYGSQIYDRVTEADTVDALREILVRQCNDFLGFYPNSPFHGRVLLYRHDLLLDYTSIESLRQFGDRTGRGYEKFCDLIIEQYDPSEIAHIVPDFYGATFGFDRSNYLSHPNYKKLEGVAKANGLTVVQLLCTMNLHHDGCHDGNRKLYDQFVRALAPQDIAYVAVQRMAAKAIEQRQWRQAFEIFGQYAPLFPADPRLKQVMALLREPEGERRLRNLGPAVNSPADDYSPVLSLDGSWLYFARKSGETGEDIFVSERKNGQWQPAQPLGREVNTRAHEVPMSLSPKGDRLFIYGNYSQLKDFYYVNRTEPHLGKGDAYMAEKTWKGWINLDALTQPVNTPHYEATMSMSADGNALLFCSDRPGVVGGHNPNYPKNKLYFHGAGEFNTDLYVSLRTDKGWGPPINLGSVLNTPYAERYPFLHPDGKTLYFVSDGHYGLGGYDIFMSKRLRDDSWTEWSAPVNVGKTLNSPGDDSFYITALGHTALVVSTQAGGLGRSDIYEVVVPEKVRPDPVVVVAGKVQDLEGKPVAATIRWEEEGGPAKGTVQADAGDGQYQLALRGGKKYVYYADERDLFGTSVTVDLTAPDKPVVSERSLEVSSFRKEAGKKALPFVMKTLHFDHNSDRIREESFYDLKRLADMMRRHPQVRLRIEGHTDSVGGDDFNLDLSRRRAQAVRAFLEREGCAPTRLGAEGFGETRPKAGNDTEEGRQLNRRVEFFVE
jgi:outer membrane protein OmpA-like peptidoglycan-associated protein